MYSSHTTRSGVGLDEPFRWGDHVCHFFRSADDLGEILVPDFKAGLERNEVCVWVTGHPYGRDRAVSEMRAAMSDFDRRTAADQIQIFTQDEWYAKQELMSTAHAGCTSSGPRAGCLARPSQTKWGSGLG
jgi:MEDS: MEthanogen/methylotroph, DcmR Sensory domain